MSHSAHQTPRFQKIVMGRAAGPEMFRRNPAIHMPEMETATYLEQPATSHIADDPAGVSAYQAGFDAGLAQMQTLMAVEVDAIRAEAARALEAEVRLWKEAAGVTICDRIREILNDHSVALSRMVAAELAPLAHGIARTETINELTRMIERAVTFHKGVRVHIHGPREFTELLADKLITHGMDVSVTEKEATEIEVQISTTRMIADLAMSALSAPSS